MKKLLKNILFVFLVFLTLSAVFALVFQPFEEIQEIPLSQVIAKINQAKIKEITVSNDEILMITDDGTKLKSQKERETALSQTLLNLGVDRERLKDIKIQTEQKGGVLAWLGPILMFLPVILFLLFFVFIFRQSRAGAGQAFHFLKAPAKLFTKEKGPKEKITFRDVAGLDEAKEELQEIVDFLKNPKKYLKMGAQIPRGVLLVGPPGTGKTMLARAVANQSGVPFFSISGSAFIELFVGVGSARVRSLFQDAKKHAPSIVFVDEIESIGKIRMPGLGGGHEEREQTLNQILAEMDGFERETGVIVMGATNAPQYLDPALLRPGRFDRRIVLDLPDVKGREEILKIHCRGKPLSSDINLKEVAERTPGFSGADLANLVNEAAIFAARKNQEKIFQRELLDSIEKVLLGPERKSHLLSENEKEISAFHEAGHALTASFLERAEEVRKVSIVARGMAAGYTLALPKQEKRIKTKSEFLADLAVLLGGYCAEVIKFGEISTGASNDLEKASLLARALVTKYGMSRLGPVSFGRREVLPFLGWEQETERNYSEKIAAAIDKETERFIRDSQQTAMKILRRKKTTLERIGRILIEKETIEKEEFEDLLKEKKKNVLKKHLSKAVAKEPEAKKKEAKSGKTRAEKTFNVPIVLKKV